MLFIPAQFLKPGMILARDLPSDFFGLALVVAGQELSQNIITRINELGLNGAYVESTLEGDVIMEEAISPALKNKLLTEVKKQFDQCTATVGISNESIAQIYRVSAEMVTSVLAKKEVLLNVISIKSYDDYTYSHSVMVGMIGVLIGIKLGFTERNLTNLAVCGLLHDIGKLDISLDIVNKPDKLTEEEFAIMQQHPLLALQRLQNNPLCNPMVLKGIESHHEKCDGSGYPCGLAGEDIPLYGRILALADVFDALTSKRCYRAAWTADQAIEYMMALSNIQFDFTLLQAFLAVIAVYPVGSVIRLSNGSVGVVTRNTAGMTLRPTLRLILPVPLLGTTVDLATDKDYLNVTVAETVTDTSILPDSLFHKK